MRRGESKIQTTDYPPKKKKLETNNAIKKKNPKRKLQHYKNKPNKKWKENPKKQFRSIPHIKINPQTISRKALNLYPKIGTQMKGKNIILKK